MTQYATIRKVRCATRGEWEASFAACDYATYFQGPEWAEIWSEYQRGAVAPCGRVVEFVDGLRAVLPLSRSRPYKGLLASYMTSPAGTFGGWISPDPLRSEHARSLARMLRGLPEITWRVNPYDPNVGSVDVRGATVDETHVVALPATFDDTFRRWSKGAKAAVKQSEREGVEVRTARSESDWRAYHDVYVDSLRRWGDHATSRYDWTLFAALARRPSERVRLWLAERQGSVIAGALCLYARRHVVYWHGAALDAHFKHRPVNLLMYESIRDACARGFAWFDFNPSGGHEGVSAFKRGFDTDVRSAHVIVNRSCWGRVVYQAALAYSYARRARSA
jgi:CelD/BcsL family acetyltransferase involved in cellulose biosynthesis